MKNKINSKFRCSQSELYAVCIIAWLTFKDQLPVFSTKKVLYTPAYADDMLAEIETVRAMPEQPARKGVLSSLRVGLDVAASDCLMQWLLLKSYIGEAYTEQLYDHKLSMAGSDHYPEAANRNWEEVSNLMAAGNTFINDYSPDLSVNNMPAGFAADYLTSMNTFNTQYATYVVAANAKGKQTQSKRTANNELYTKTMKMCKDGRLIFKADEALKKQFVFENLLRIVSSVGNAGLRGTIINAKTAVGMEGVALSLYMGTNIQNTPKYTTVTSANGGYDFGNVVSGNYTMKMEKAGFVIRMEAAEIKVGVVSSKTFMMVEQ